MLRRSSLAPAILAAAWITGCHSGPAGSSAPPPIESTFDAGDEGWTLQGFNSDANDYSVSSMLTAPAVYDPTGGNPGGALERHETFFGYADYFQAPPKFLGDLSGYYGGALTYGLRDSDVSSLFDAPLVLLASASDTWRYDAPSSPETTWSIFTVPLSPGGWTRVSDGSAADEASLRQALGAVSALWIRGEFSNNVDDSWVDNVVVGP